MITIVDYGMGNLGSLANMIRKVGGECEITGDLDAIQMATKLVLPGVGSFDAAMQRIGESGLQDRLNSKVVDEKTPVLGICLGMQLLTDGSEEGELPGLGWIPGRASRFRPSSKEYKVPHMGWNRVTKASSCVLTDPLPEDARFYFVHSYAVAVKDVAHRVLTARHEIEFDAFIQKDNVYGAQFHPEKSHRFGMVILREFVGI